MPWISGDHAHIRSESVEAFWIEPAYDNRHVIKALVHGHPVTLATADTIEDAEALIERVLVNIERSEGDRWQHAASPLPGSEPRDLTPKERQLLDAAHNDRIDEHKTARLLGCSVGQLSEHGVIKSLTGLGLLSHIVDGPRGFYWITAKGREAVG